MTNTLALLILSFFLGSLLGFVSAWYLLKRAKPPTAKPSQKSSSEKIKSPTPIKKLPSSDLLKESYSFAGLQTRSHRMREIFQAVKLAAQSQATVLIEGESGTGKERIARALHESSPRSSGPFVAVHIAALAPSLMESELFGFEKGAFTGAHQSQVGRFEAAHGGTLFLDEVGEIPLELQVKLLRVLQERYIERLGSTQRRDIDVRILAATNRDLRQEVQAGNFREDLYYRLNIIPLHLIPLRQRKADLPLLIEEILQEQATKNHKELQSYSAAFLNKLQDYDFPGNIRELSNLIERAVVFSAGKQLEVESLHFSQDSKKAPLETSEISQFKKDLDYDKILATYHETQGNKAEAARILGLKESTYRYRLKKALEKKGNH